MFLAVTFKKKQICAHNKYTTQYPMASNFCTINFILIYWVSANEGKYYNFVFISEHPFNTCSGKLSHNADMGKRLFRRNTNVRHKYFKELDKTYMLL